MAKYVNGSAGALTSLSPGFEQKLIFREVYIAGLTRIAINLGGDEFRDRCEQAEMRGAYHRMEVNERIFVRSLHRS